MKKVKILLIFVILLTAGISSLYGQKCNIKQSGYNLKINGFDVCVLDNTKRECFAIVNPCPEQ
jgi:hypothetical protein